MAAIDFTISRRLENQCRDWCRRWFPREAYGFLLGTMLGSSVHVDELWLPSEADAEECFKTDRVYFKPDWAAEIKDAAEESDLMLVGDFHSHPYLLGEMSMDPVQSAADLDYAGKHAIFGVVNVEQMPSGRLMTKLRWWGPSVKVLVRRTHDVPSDLAVGRTGRRGVASPGRHPGRSPRKTRKTRRD